MRVFPIFAACRNGLVLATTKAYQCGRASAQYKCMLCGNGVELPHACLRQRFLCKTTVRQLLLSP